MVKELRKKTNQELCDLIIKIKSQLLEFRFKEAMGKLDKPHKVRLAKKTIAIIYTILHERNVELLISNTDYAIVEYVDGVKKVRSIRNEIKALQAKKELPKKPKESKPTKKEDTVNAELK